MLPETVVRNCERVGVLFGGGAVMVTPKLRVGGTVKFADDKRVYTIRAMSERYAICTTPFPKLDTVMYTIIDNDKMIRGPNDLVLNIYDYTLETECEKTLRDLLANIVGISRRRSVSLVFEWIRSAEGKQVQ